ncbi:MAG: hypothetical protein DMD59_13870 [Gemmatimonadetes bacterium]|nr:MAG: hypothetical protein DMD59_13870 [Gemmatimonadota bacterium]
MIKPTLLALLACTTAARAVAQDVPQRMTYGIEIAFRSGHGDRGFIINDRPVVQPVMWFSGRGTEFSAWSSFAVAQTTDGARPQIVELELTHEHKLGRLTVGPALRMYFYHDALSADRDRSLEGWLNLSYDVGPFQLFTRQSLDVLTYKGAYFVDAGIESEQRISPPLVIGGSLGAGWASWRFNYAYAAVAKSTLDRVRAATWLTVHLKQFYVGPHLEFSTIVDPAVRAAVNRPTYLLVRLSMGGEF